MQANGRVRDVEQQHDKRDAQRTEEGRQRGRQVQVLGDLRVRFGAP
jgi:hypothetical protein